VLGFYLIGSRGWHKLAVSWLVGASFFFYGWWNPPYVLLLLGSIIFNYAAGISLSEKQRRGTLIIGVTANLGLLGYFKYSNFFIDNINVLIGSDIIFNQVILPLAISFFTFQQITYLVDSYRGESRENSFLHYCLFVTFFPQLIAGPIVHHREMLPQFAKDSLYKLNPKNLSVGAIIFIIGLFKKIVLADGMAFYASPIFTQAELNEPLTFLGAWAGALAYTLQLYFDFSGYADMAIGIARMFGIILPANYLSPYKATSIIEFWRRWHMTLSRFFRDYLYLPMGGNRKGAFGNMCNLLIVMLLGGLWHGASWTFIIWGGINGMGIALNHGFRSIRSSLGHDLSKTHVLGQSASWCLTFVFIVFAWVIFRSESVNGAHNMFQAMLGLKGLLFPEFVDYQLLGALCFLLFVVCFMPSTQEFLLEYNPSLNIYSGNAETPRYHWILQYKPSSFVHILFVSLMVVLSIVAMMSNSSTEQPAEFLYYNF
jgi:D-alanyl-lipoteichoic acid acyltransferase DltB (MBOAT superfamily)